MADSRGFAVRTSLLQLQEPPREGRLSLHLGLQPEVRREGKMKEPGKLKREDELWESRLALLPPSLQHT